MIFRTANVLSLLSEDISVTILRVIGFLGLVRNVRNESAEERIPIQNFAQDQPFKAVI